jgi:hypothetical protein
MSTRRPIFGFGSDKILDAALRVATLAEQRINSIRR